MNNGHLTNHAAVREFALLVAHRIRPAARFTRISETFIHRIEGKLCAIIAAEVHAAPSIGVTIK